MKRSKELEIYKFAISDCCKSPIKHWAGTWCICKKCKKFRQYKSLIISDNGTE